MPEFFIPMAMHADQAERVYRSIRELNASLGPFSDRRIHSLDYAHDDARQYAEVGAYDLRTGEMVIAILEAATRDRYHICTEEHGVRAGRPITVPADGTTHVRAFRSSTKEDDDTDGIMITEKIRLTRIVGVENIDRTVKRLAEDLGLANLEVAWEHEDWTGTARMSIRSGASLAAFEVSWEQIEASTLAVHADVLAEARRVLRRMKASREAKG